jgi:hypothetical protein
MKALAQANTAPMATMVILMLTSQGSDARRRKLKRRGVKRRRSRGRRPNKERRNMRSI